jgi:hypothetical protein
MQKHVTAAQKAQYLADVPISELAKRAAEEEIAILDYAKLIRGELTQCFLLASQCRDHHAAATLGHRLTDLLSFIGRLTGELRQVAPGAITNNMAIFVNSPAFSRLEKMLLKRLAGFPDALRSVIEGLRELEEETSPAASVSTLAGIPVIEARAEHVGA